MTSMERLGRRSKTILINFTFSIYLSEALQEVKKTDFSHVDLVVCESSDKETKYYCLRNPTSFFAMAYKVVWPLSCICGK